MKTRVCTGCTSVWFNSKKNYEERCLDKERPIAHFRGTLPEDWIYVKDLYAFLGPIGEYHYLCPKCIKYAEKLNMQFRRLRHGE